MFEKVICLGVLAIFPVTAASQNLTALNVNLEDRRQVLSFLEANISNDDAIISFYQRVDSWEDMRDLRRYSLPPHIWNHLADARTNLVKRLYAAVHREILESEDIYLNDPRKETHFIGTPPSARNFKGVFSDLDVGMFLDPSCSTIPECPEKQRAGLTLPERQVYQIKAKQSMEAKLKDYALDSGYVFDTNLYTTPEMFSEAEIGDSGRQELERYDDVMAYLAIRIGADEGRWSNLKQLIIDEVCSENITPAINECPVVSKLVEDAETKYKLFEEIKNRAKIEAKEIYLGLDEQELTRHFEDQFLRFINQHGKELSANNESGQALRTQYNKLKADYEASLRESYFTFAAQNFIVRWGSKSPEQKQEFLNDPNKVWRVRADQARFILHYLDHKSSGNELEDLQFKLQKIAKYEQRAMKVVRESGGNPSMLECFSEQTCFTFDQIDKLFSEMKGKNTPEEAWVLWRKYNYNGLNNKQDLNQEIPDSETKKAEEYAILRAKVYLKHIEEKIVDIATYLPSI